jgi:8-oxo-dGTP pyrophosphatase MutT (NUDIX family)
MTFAQVHDDAEAVLRSWQPAEPGQTALREAYLGFLAARPDSVQRACAAGHLTASAVVLRPDRTAVLLTLHPRVGRWLQLGGHVEDADDSITGAALREATEESGIDGLVLDPVPLRLDVHPITCSLGVPTRHFDVQFRAFAPEGATAVRSSESTDLQWWPADALPAGVDATVTALVAAAVARD